MKLLASCFLFLLVGCSGMLYYPTQVLYVNPEKLQPVPEEHHFKLADGTEINGWYFHAEKPRAKILFFHGNGQNRSAQFLFLHWLVEKGYDLAVFDYPGYGTSEGSPSPESTVQMGKAALHYVKALGPDLPLVVYGHSLGGVVAARTVWEERENIKPALLVLDSTFVSYRRAGAAVMSHSYLTWLLQPLAYVFLSDSWASVDVLAEIKTPVVVIHSRQDMTIPLRSGQEVYDKASQPKEIWIKESGGHYQSYQGPEGNVFKAKLLERLP